MARRSSLASPFVLPRKWVTVVKGATVRTVFVLGHKMVGITPSIRFRYADRHGQARTYTMGMPEFTTRFQPRA